MPYSRETPCILQDDTRTLQCQVNVMKCVISISVLTGAAGIVTKRLRKTLQALRGKHSVDSLQKTAVLGTSHIILKVLQCETGRGSPLVREKYQEGEACDKRQR